MCVQQSLRSACAYAQSDQSLCLSLTYYTCMTVKLLTEHHLKFLSLKGGCTCSSEPTIVKMPHCWKSHVTAHFTTAAWYVIAYWQCHFSNVHEQHWFSGEPSKLLQKCIGKSRRLALFGAYIC